MTIRLTLNFIPFPELKTGKLLLRRLDKADANKIFFLRSNEEVLRYVGKEPAATESTGFVKEAHLKENLYFRGKFDDTLIYSKLNK